MFFYLSFFTVIYCEYIYLHIYAYVYKYIYICMYDAHICNICVYSWCIYFSTYAHVFHICMDILYVLELRIVCPAKTCQQISGNSQCSSGMYVCSYIDSSLHSCTMLLQSNKHPTFKFIYHCIIASHAQYLNSSK